MSNHFKRQKIFHKATEGLRGIGLDVGYICPICHEVFDQSDLEANLLTLEHVPPRSRGGRQIILTCKPCNSGAGHSSDAHAAELSKLEEGTSRILGRGNGECGNFTLGMDGNAVRVAARREGGTITFTVRSGYNSPSSIEAFRDAMKQATAGSSMTLKSQGSFVPRLAAISDARSAFLLCAAKFGYSFALDENLNCLREQIMHPESKICDVGYVKSTGLPSGLILVCPEENLVALRIGERSLLLPWIGDSPTAYCVERRPEFPPAKLEGLGFAFPRSFEAAHDRYLQSLGFRYWPAPPSAVSPTSG